MDELDVILFDAWNRISAKAQRNRMLAFKRWRRTNKGILTKPLREWCLVIRASDTRFEHTARSLVDAWKMTKHRAHVLNISGELIREVTKPVNIPRPGVRYEKAAKMLGRTYDSLHQWVRKGVFRVERSKWSRDYQYTRRGKRVYLGRPYVSTRGPIDPNCFHGRPPHAVWGTLWQWRWDKMRRDHRLLVRREPRVRVQWSYAGDRPKFLGWEFVCPGLVKPDGTHEPCGRRCTYLYFPMPVFTMGKFLTGIDDAGFDLPPADELRRDDRWRDAVERQREKGKWKPGFKELVAGTKERPRCFACKHCWKVRTACMSNAKGWHAFVTTLSGGLLTGRDVPRPARTYGMTRRKKPYRKRTRQEMEAARRRKAA